jgi:signal peptidase II
MQFLLMSLFALGIVALDQWTKFLVLQNIPLYGHVDAIEGLFHLTYVRNTGAAFSAFAGAQWLFALIFLVLTAAIIYEYFWKRQPFTTAERWLIAARCIK